ncbi:LOW QUALITY PROTEIN: E3 ubiquitin-protein ligase ZNRF4 [Pteronotus mesoamericanus]|uniref:LOW QUALITY PROTEIN: E3 ubiquitin-protein ligase ZNRF4 n=1 Tax=Pteronotus mesoamericanus TaxID=1884717 RepID=UPI0023EB9110|nr:LOW QUALITY PROTEIN: E3 ubiquitin-protein ligase ZNRF4 [Pteronotus parnellii mesoamericanus]
MSQRVGASGILGAPGLSVICQQGHPARVSPPETSLQIHNANVPATRSSFRLGLRRSQLLCLPACEPALEAHLHSILAAAPGSPWRCPKASHLPFPVGPRFQPKQAVEEAGVTMGWRRPALALRVVRASLILLALLVPSQALVRAVLDGNSSTVDFEDLPAMFGVPLAPEGVRGYLMEAKPANACHPIEGPQPGGNGSLGAIVLIRRYDCTFDLKVLHAQQAGFKAAIVHNVLSDDLVRMAHVYEDLRRQISIPAVFVGEATSEDLRLIVCCDKSAHVLLLPNYPPCPDLDCHPVLAISWALGCALALLMSAFFILRYLWNWLWSWWTCGPAVVKMPACRKAQVRTFTRLNDTCAICLDEYEEGEQLKILPCSHIYHCKCIDPWFSQAAQRSCPVCKQSVSSTEDSSDSTIESIDEDPPPQGYQPPIWAIQARLRSRRLELLARASPHHRCSATSVGVAEAMESSESSPGSL